MLSTPVKETTNRTTRNNASPFRQSAPELQPLSAIAVLRNGRTSPAVARNAGQQTAWSRASADAPSLYGNQATLRMLNRSLNSSAPVLQRKCAGEGSEGQGAQCNDEKEMSLQRHAG